MRELLWPFFYVFIGGGVGSVLRFAISMFMQRSTASYYPYGTFTVNVIGSLLIGFILTYIESHTMQFAYWRQLLVIGLLGGFTTFSSFSWDTMALFKNHEAIAAFINIGANVGLCLLAAYAGSWLVKVIL